MSRLDVFRVLARPQYATGAADDRFPRPLTEIAGTPRVRYALDGRDSLSFAVAATAEIRDLLTARRVIRLTPAGESPTEWLISRVNELAGPAGQGVLTVECDPIRVVLGDVGIMEVVDVGGQSYANLGGLNGNARNYLRTFAIEHLVRRGITWIKNGTIQPTQQFDFSWDAMTPLALIEALAKETGSEWTLRDTGSEYEIDLVERVGGSIETVQAKEGLNILELQNARNRERLFTSIRPSGALPAGSEERANIGFNTWRVTDVTGDVVEVEPHNGGLGAIIEDDQHVGLYLEAADGTFWEIEDSSEADQSFTLETGAGASFAVDDDVMIVADDQGTLMTSVESPSGVAEYGFVQGNISGRNFGNRNWMRNPSFADWPVKPLQTIARVDGSSSGTTVALKELPPNFAILANDLLVTRDAIVRLITANATADGSGNVSVTVNQNVAVGDNNGVIVVRVNTNLPTYWSVLNTNQPFVFSAGQAGEINQSCNADGAQVNRSQVALKNLPANFFIPAGTQVSGNSFTVENATANSSGLATVKVMDALQNYADNAAITLRRPALSQDAVGGLMWQTGGLIDQTFLFQPFQIRTLGATEQVKMVARMAAWSPTVKTFGGTLPGLRVDFLDSSGGTIQAGVADTTDIDVTYKLFSIRNSVSSTVASGQYRMSIRVPYSTLDGGQPVWFLLSTQVYIGDFEPPVIEGSHATALFQEGQLALLTSRQWPATYTVRLSEIVSQWGLDPSSAALSLGNFLRVRSPSVGVDAILRIVAIEYDPLNPGDRVYTLDTDPERISQLTARARPRPVFVDVSLDIQVDNQGQGTARETVLVTDAPPVAAPGAERFVVAAGTVAPSTDVALPVSPLEL